MRELLTNLKNTTHLRYRQIHRFKSKVSLYIEFGPYILKTAETQRELLESFRLRHEVFNGEFRGVQKAGLDVDAFDRSFDHLIIIEKTTGALIGTYRVNCTTELKGSYTGLEFDLTEIFQMRGPFLELGRACIHKDFRKGAIISLLWRGIAEYMNLSESNVLFGCSSVKVTDPREAALIYKHLQEQGSVIPMNLASPTKKYKMLGFEAALYELSGGLSDAQKAKAEELIPSLLKSYLKLGARIAAFPAYDEEFLCIDMLTLLRKEDLPDSIVKRFQVAKAPTEISV